MNPDKPPPNIQMTPVEFSPAQSVGDVGTIVPAPRPRTQFPVFLPLLIILLTLIFSTVRDIVALNRRMTGINAENAPALELLKKSAAQTQFVESFRKDLLSQASSDPVMAQIAKDYFPATPAQTRAPQDTSDKTPAK